ncbi:MAG: AfsA-related hotdog domain-containing protein [Pseudomonas sp.]|uniref:AfsA-related hotdog domain-containing protein n=1 Tax=Pseudomonas sp. TaxID=306 RepID=UPI003393AB40
MSQNRMLIVGDRFEQFAQHPQVLSISAAEALLQGETLDHNLRLQLGQGISSPRLDGLLGLAESHKKRQLLAFDRPEKAGRQLAHKHDPRNSMISLPRRVGPSSFVLDVWLDEDCAELSDHMTGQHIQGMVLLEATRQAFLAVTEEFYLKDTPHSSYFVINQMDTEYLHFVFPLPISILYEIEDYQAGKRDTHRFQVSMSVIQNETVCCVVKTRFSTYPDSFISSKEEGLARAALEQELYGEAQHEKRA